MKKQGLNNPALVAVASSPAGQKAISKRYAINCYTLEVKNYLEMKLRLRKTI